MRESRGGSTVRAFLMRMASVAIALCVVCPATAWAQAQALGLTWRGHADTDLRFSEFFGGNHTIAVRFMPQFPTAYEGPIIAENGSGTFFLGQGDYLLNGERTNLVLTVGTTSRTYTTSLTAGTWAHLAVVATTSGTQRSFRLYVNGAAVGTPLTVSTTATQMPAGTLRFGKRTTGQTVGGHDAQFYGFVDDVAVFTRALSAAEVANLNTRANLAAAPPSGLLAGYVFDQGVLPAAFVRPLNPVGSARRIDVSGIRNNTVDAARLPLPTEHQEVTLPFKVGEAWAVGQGYGGLTSHHGYAAFSLDLSLADRGANSELPYPTGSAGAPFYAIAPGQVVTALESHGPGGSISNLVEVQQAPGEIAGYLHLQKDSAIPVVGSGVLRRDQLAKVGNSGTGGNHLHLATTNLRDGTFGFVTFPVALSNYEVRTSTNSWRRVFRGIPKDGEVLRVPAEPTARYNVVFMPSSAKEYHLEGYRYADFRAAYDGLFPQGWRLHQLHAYVENSVVLYNAVWRPGTNGETQIYGATYEQYRSYYDEIFPQGWRLQILQSYVLNGQVLYNAVWRPATNGEIQFYGATYEQYRSYYDEIFPQGWRLQILQSYVLNGQVLYNAVWRPATNGEIQIYGATYRDYMQTYDQLRGQGWRIALVDAYK
jgi:hypothetical protein